MCPTVFEVKVKNSSSNQATNAFLTAMVPSPYKELIATSPAGACVVDPPCAGVNCDRLLRCPLGTIAGGSEVVVTISLKREAGTPRLFSVAGVVADQVEDVNILDNGSSFNIWARRRGDYNGSGAVDVTDSLLLQCFIVGNCSTQQYPQFNADYADFAPACGVIDVLDLVVLSNYIVGNVECLTPPECSRSPEFQASTQGLGIAMAAPLVAGGKISVPLVLDLTGVTVASQPAALAGYLARVTFDPAAVALSGARVAGDRNFKDDPVFTNPDKANARGSALIVSVHADRQGSPGAVRLATLEFDELKPGGASSISVELVQASTPLFSDGRPRSIPVSAGGKK